MRPGTITIAMACDGPYLHPFAVALSSLVRHASQPVHLWFGLAADWKLRLSERDLEQVLEFAEAVGVSVSVRKTDIAVDSLPPTLHISPTAFVKLAMLDLCEAGETVVWFDADLMARRDWTSIMGAASGHGISGVHESQPSFEAIWPAATKDWYVNTGVMVVQGDEWQQVFAGRWTEYLERYSEYGFRYLDQDVLNALVRNQWNLLPQDYNFRLGHSGVWVDPPVVHFAGWWKPWLRTRRQSRLLTGEWKLTFDEYAEAEAHVAELVQERLGSDSCHFWHAQRRSTRGLGGWRATRHYVKGVLIG